MNDKLIDTQAMQQLLRKNKWDWLNLRFQDCYGHLVVTAEINPTSYSRLSVSGVANSAESAFKRALKRLEKIQALPKEIKIEEPDTEKQPHEGGYHTEMITDELEVVFRRRGDGFTITDLRRKDKDGFIYLEEPRDLPTDGKWKFIRNLDDGYQLWKWDDIRPLSGTAGEAIVYNGKIIKTRTTAIS